MAGLTCVSQLSTTASQSSSLQVTCHQCFHSGSLKSVSLCLLRAGGLRDSPELGCWARGALPGRLMALYLVWISRRILHVAVFPGKWLLGLYPLHLKEEYGCFFPAVYAGCAFWLIPARWWQWSSPGLEPIKITFSFPSCVIIWQRWWCILLPCVCKCCSYNKQHLLQQSSSWNLLLLWWSALQIHHLNSSQQQWVPLRCCFKSSVLKKCFFPSHLIGKDCFERQGKDKEQYAK